MTMKDVQDLFSYDEWATNRTLDSVSTLSDEDYKHDLKSSHGGIHDTLVHICAADCIWLERWKGNSPTALMTAGDLPTLDALKDRWNLFRKEISTFLQTLDENRLQQPLSYKDTKGNAFSQLLYRLLMHKVNHASYHRGQIVTMLRQVGAKPQNTDLSAFYRTLQQ